MHHKEAGIDDAFPGDGDVVEHILGVLYSGRSIDIAAEFRADALQVLQHLFTGQILESVEAHMLQEVGKTVLVGSFLDCTNVCCQIELRPLGRFVVMTDVIGHAVVELADLDGRIVGKRRLRVSQHCRCKKQRD